MRRLIGEGLLVLACVLIVALYLLVGTMVVALVVQHVAASVQQSKDG